MSCLDVMYQVYGPPQPYFAAAYTPYHQVRVSSRPDRVDRWRAPASPSTASAPRSPVPPRRSKGGRPAAGASDAGIARAATQ